MINKKESSLSKIVARAHRDPDTFYKDGSLDELLAAVRKSGRLDIVVDFLQSNKVVERRIGSWTSSELAIEAAPIIEHIVNLVSSNDRATVYYALECIASVSEQDASLLRHLTDATAHPDPVIARLANYLISNSGV
ncbi:hypothetical protein NOG11_14875 [Parvularcula sp. BGMRC 0090]|uniref:HEAT repeat domain-containing protein n=2 Tax=Parvularcula maris TaxID=2965077 RepID=A0A9X2RK76_9PROT|nr:hypothetical protein [Parvularcula maris]